MSLRINGIILFVCTDEFHKTGLPPVVDSDDEAVFVARNVKHDPAVFQDAGGTVLRLDFLGVLPCRTGNFLVPCFKGRFGIHVCRGGFPKLPQCALGNYSHFVPDGCYMV